MNWVVIVYILLATLPLWFVGVALWRLGTRLWDIHIHHKWPDEDEDETEQWKHPDSI